jgi:hypothetical protein
MLTYKGGHTVGKGTYWDMTNGRRIDVVSEAVLAGGGRATYIRMSPGFLLLSGPVIGLLYAIMMPFLGIATAAALGVSSVLGGIYHSAAKSVSFGWRPKNAYLAGKKKKNETK